MPNKISFESARNALADARLLVAASRMISSDKKGFPQNRTDGLQDTDIFIAIKGEHTDSHDLIALAVRNGAGMLVIENREKLGALATAEHTVNWLQVSNTRAAWTILSARAYGNPEQKLQFYGVTGTDGKTSTVWLASQLIRRHQQKCLSLGTLGAYDGTTHWKLEHTTADPPVFFSALADCKAKAIPNVIMEVSSHSLIQQKVCNIKFSGAVLTSFSRDHLDFHKNMKDYWAAKCLLFESLLKKDGKAIVHHKLLEDFPEASIPTRDLWTYGFDPEQNVKRDLHVALLDCQPHTHGQYIRFTFRGETFEGAIPYLGMHNAENFIAAWLIAESVLSYSPAPETWTDLAPIPGRCELVSTSESAPKVYVDFAHTPQALRMILTTLRKSVRGKLWVVFGCGGDRDRGKRPEMAAIAEILADRLFLTSDNPRHEEPLSIIAEMRAGLKMPTQATIEVDRKKAIGLAIKEAALMDTILIAGKGHESEQIIGDRKTPFSDQATARQFLKDLWS